MRRHHLVLGLVAWLLASAKSHAQPLPPPTVAARAPTQPTAAAQLRQAQPVADAALASFKRTVTPERARRLGFGDVAEVRRATLGVPTFEFVVPLDELARYQSGTDPNPLLKSRNELKYPILVDGAVRSSVSIALVNNVWKEVSLGTPRLTQFIDAARAAKMTELGRAASTFFVVRVPALKVILLGHTDGGALFLTPIIDDARVGLQRGQTLAADVVFTRLVPLAQGHDGLPG
jgi:hypothetical protein